MILFDQDEADATFAYFLSAAGSDAIALWMKLKWKMAVGFQTQEAYS